MAYYRCGSSGGAMKETVYWTNSSPTSNFAAQTVTLSGDITQNDFIKITFRATTTNSKSGSVIYPMSEWINMNGTTSESPNGGLCVFMATSTVVRPCSYVSSTRVRFELAATGGATTTTPIRAIPLQIIGMKL